MSAEGRGGWLAAGTSARFLASNSPPPPSLTAPPQRRISFSPFHRPLHLGACMVCASTCAAFDDARTLPPQLCARLSVLGAAGIQVGSFTFSFSFLFLLCSRACAVHMCLRAPPCVRCPLPPAASCVLLHSCPSARWCLCRRLFFVRVFLRFPVLSLNASSRPPRSSRSPWKKERDEGAHGVV